MNRKITKQIAAAIIIITGLLSLTIFDKTVTSAWAIEQSIEAMKDFRGLYLSGTINMSWEDFFSDLGTEGVPELPESIGTFEMWAQADENLSRSSSAKIICPDNIVISGSKLHNYVQLADGTTYDIPGDHFKLQPWFTRALEVMKAEATSSTELYGIDAETGKKQIYMACSSSTQNKSWKIEFDAETKLLISLKQWNKNDNYEGTPSIDINKIVYFENLPDDIFEIDIPESEKIIAVSTPLYDPDYGISAEGLTREQACYKIVQELWQAVNEKDFEKVCKLVPLTENWTDEQMNNNFGLDQGPTELLEMGTIYESTLGPTVPCTFEEVGQKKVVDLIIMFREIDGKSSCIIHSNKGQSRPIE